MAHYIDKLISPVTIQRIGDGFYFYPGVPDSSTPFIYDGSATKLQEMLDSGYYRIVSGSATLGVVTTDLAPQNGVNFVVDAKLTAFLNKYSNPNVAPNAPTNLTVTGGNNQATLNWLAPAGAVSYKVKRSTTTGTETTLAAGGSVNGLTFTDTTATGGTLYYYVVTAINAYGESPASNEVSVTPFNNNVAPNAPTGLSVTAGTNQATLNWAASTGAASYNVKRSTTSGTETTLATGGSVNATTFTDTTAAGGTLYYYAVTAINAYGESPKSNEVSVTPSGSMSASDTAITGISNLIRWHKQDTIAVANGANVTSWLDSSTASNNASTSTTYPTFVTGAFANGKSAVSFNGVAQYLQGPGFSFTNGMCATFVLKTNNASPTGNPTAISYDAAGSGANDYVDSNGAILYAEQSATQAFTAHAQNYPIVNSSNGAWHVITVRMDYLTSSTMNYIMRVDGVQGANQSLSLGAVATPTFIVFGCGYASGANAHFLNCYIAEFALWATTVTDTQIHNVEQQLGTKYGITVS